MDYESFEPLPLKNSYFVFRATKRCDKLVKCVQGGEKNEQKGQNSNWDPGGIRTHNHRKIESRAQCLIH